jgi:cytochrome c oxidase assembly protein subunit 15
MFLYPLSRMTGAIYLEHAHRLFGALVGLTTLALVVFTFARDRRPVARTLVLISFLAVAAQGVVGGLRVTETSPVLALLHGVAAQLIFALLGVCAVVLSPTWKRSPAPAARPGAAGLRTLAVIAFIALIIQVGLGGAIRHFNRDTLPMHAVISHAAWSVVVLVLLVALGVKSRRALSDLRPLRVCGTGLLHGVSGQFLLGWIALAVALAYPVRDEAPAVRAVIATAHQTIGALLLAFTAMLYAWSRRLLLALPAPGRRG